MDSEFLTIIDFQLSLVLLFVVASAFLSGVGQGDTLMTPTHTITTGVDFLESVRGFFACHCQRGKLTFLIPITNSHAQYLSQAQYISLHFCLPLQLSFPVTRLTETYRGYTELRLSLITWRGLQAAALNFHQTALLHWGTLISDTKKIWLKPRNFISLGLPSMKIRVKKPVSKDKFS